MSGLIILIILFFIVRFVFRNVLPVVKVFTEANRKVRDMQSGNMQTGAGQVPPVRPHRQPKKGDYIDYEEVK